MKRLTVLLIIGCAAVLVGAMLFGLGILSLGDADLLTVEYKSISESGTIDKIVIDYSTADVTVTVSDTAETVSVEYPVMKNKKGESTSEITAKCKDGTLTITEQPIWYRNLFLFGMESATVKVTVPRYRELEYSLSCDTCDITLEDGVRASSMSLCTDTGDVKIGQIVVSERLKVETDTGKIDLVGETAAEHIDLSTDTGRITVSAKLLANTVALETDTGRITLSAPLRAAKLRIESSTGDVSVTDEIDAHIIEVSTSTGDISLLLSGARALYTVTAETSTGDSNVASGGAGERRLSVTTSTGDIRISFADEEKGESL